MANTLLTAIVAPSAIVTLTGTETLTNKTLTSPTMTTPTLGVASATSINKVAITAPANGSTLTISDGKTLTASNTLTFTGTDASSVAFGAGGTVLYSGGALGTPSSGTLTNATGLPVSGITASTSTALGVGSIELGHATDTTIARSAAGVVTIEGVEIVTLSRSQTLTNKSLTSPVITGTLTAGGGVGTNGQLLASTGSGLQWVTRDVSTLDSLTDVTISSPSANQILKFTGSAWINADPDTAVASAVFANNAQSDLGSVADAIIASEEDLGVVTDVASLIYDMGRLALDGIVSLNNIDQSIKADYIGYAIIFGF
jgi:hypothetical protein